MASGHRWVLCVDCVRRFVDDVATADEEAEAILDDLWNLPTHEAAP